MSAYNEIKEKNKIYSEYFLSSEAVLKKYDIDAGACEDIKESFGLVEDMLLYFTLTTLSN
ncbi:hypothetical protein [Acetobacterium bakii]|uniref:Uncharacterized protein n=1 Tax=Acetobacterium bakii TaxID=52689 RepID=A0A0L6U525_9FIRM|nr:hypothetical protein [Acetobacterium bakii]KNZ43631.1 hypothetical protein AKG39_00300 [Acetobacterium bakii]